jgi:serine/threonine protein kinase
MDDVTSKHPSDRALSSFALGKLDDKSAEAVNKHLEQCLDCRKRVASMSADSFLGRIRDAQASGEHGISQSQTSAMDSQTTSGGCTPPAASTLPPGLADHPDYEIKRELGRGGMGVVYLVHNKLMGREEVLKVVSGHLIKRPAVLERFLREIRSAAKLHHANIVTAYSAFRAGESIVFAMEYVKGHDLAQIVKGNGPLHVAHACNFAYQAALGLQYAHEKGMVHRDIKPSNLILTKEGKKPVVKVLDFGLAKVTSEGQGESDLTREGQMLGTPDYIAPEQIRDAQSADIRADVYSLGCTLYYLLAGRPPFARAKLWDLYEAHFYAEAGPLNLIRPEVPVELAALVAKMLAKEPARRLQTPGEVAQAMTRFFKTAASKSSVPCAKLSGINPPATPPQTSEVGPVPAQSTTPAAALDPPVRTSSKTGAEDVAWESLIEITEEDPVVDAVRPEPPEPRRGRAEGPVRRPPWMWTTIAAASLLGLMTLGVIIVHIGGKNDETRTPAEGDRSVRAENREGVACTTSNENPPRAAGKNAPKTAPAGNPGVSSAVNGNNKLVGSWKLVSPVHIGSLIQVKHVTPTGFMWAIFDAATMQIIVGAGGTYELDADTYVERYLYAIGREPTGLLDEPQRFTRIIDGGKWFHAGVLSSGLKVEEVWEREAGAAAGRDADGQNKELIGTWKMVVAKSDGQASGDPMRLICIEHVTPTHFIWAHIDPETKHARYSAGGTYTLEGETLVETMQYTFGRGFEELRGRPQRFTCRIEGNKRFHAGKLTSGLSIEEVWERQTAPTPK